uniref:UPAR/Ly6 domain-containing protein n=1 Tax=Fundulus heteroclitus TaxID=8078 RepID=A0A3Q2Q1B1_FUNHE
GGGVKLPVSLFSWNMTASVNLGSQSATASAECCSADDCNSRTLPPPPTQSPNTLQCIACDSNSSECKTIITCSGNEKNCFNATGEFNKLTTNTKCICVGTKQSSIKAKIYSHGSLLLTEIVGSVISGPTCCATNLCNAPRTTTTISTNNDASSFRLGLLHLILGIFIFII